MLETSFITVHPLTVHQSIRRHAVGTAEDERPSGCRRVKASWASLMHEIVA